MKEEERELSEDFKMMKSNKEQSDDTYDMVEEDEKVKAGKVAKDKKQDEYDMLMEEKKAAAKADKIIVTALKSKAIRKDKRDIYKPSSEQRNKGYSFKDGKFKIEN